MCFFEHNRQNKILAIYLNGTSLNAQKQLVEKVIIIEINNGNDLKNMQQTGIKRIYKNY